MPRLSDIVQRQRNATTPAPAVVEETPTPASAPPPAPEAPVPAVSTATVPTASTPTAKRRKAPAPPRFSDFSPDLAAKVIGDVEPRKPGFGDLKQTEFDQAQTAKTEGGEAADVLDTLADLKKNPLGLPEIGSREDAEKALAKGVEAAKTGGALGRQAADVAVRATAREIAGDTTQGAALAGAVEAGLDESRRLEKGIAEGRATPLREGALDRKEQEEYTRAAEANRAVRLREKIRKQIPDVDAVLSLVEDVNTNRKLEGGKANVAFLVDRSKQIAQDHVRPDMDANVIKTIEERARLQAQRELAMLSNEGAWAYPVTEASMEQARRIASGEGPEFTDYVRAVLPQRVLSPSGQSSRTENLGMAVVNALSIPEFLAVAALDANLSGEPFSKKALESVANRTDIVTYWLENDPQTRSDLTSGDDARVTDAVERLLPVMAASIVFPDVGETVAAPFKGARLVSMLNEMRKTGAAARAAKVLKEGGSVADAVKEAEKAVRGADAAVEAADAEKKRAKIVKPVEDAAMRFDGDVEDVARQLDEEARKKGLVEDPVAKKLRDDTLAALGSDPDVAAWMDQVDVQGIADPNLWPEPAPVPDAADLEARIAEARARLGEVSAGVEDEARAAGRRMEPGELATNADVRALEKEIADLRAELRKIPDYEAAQRGVEKAKKAYPDIGKKVFEDAQTQAAGETTPARRRSDFYVEPPKPPTRQAFAAEYAERLRADAEAYATHFPDDPRGRDDVTFWEERRAAAERGETFDVDFLVEHAQNRDRAPATFAEDVPTPVAATPATPRLSDDDLRALFGTRVRADQVRKVLDAETAEDFVKAARHLPSEVREALAGRVLAAMGRADTTDAWKTLREILEADPAAWRGKADAIARAANARVARLDAARAAKAEKQAALRAALESQAVAPEHRAKLEASRKKVEEAERAYREALRETERAGEADLGKKSAAVERAKKRLDDLRARVAPPKPEAAPPAPAAPAPSARPERAGGRGFGTRVSMEDILDPVKRWQMEQRFGTLDEQTGEIVGEPYTLPDHAVARPSANELPASTQDRLFKLLEQREVRNLRQYLWTGEGKLENPADGEGALAFAEKFDLLPQDDLVTPRKLRKPDGTLTDGYADLQREAAKGAAKNPDLPPARSWNQFFRAKLSRSDTYLVGPRAKYARDPDVIRPLDYVYVSNPDLPKPMPAQVVGFTKAPDGTPRVLVAPLQPLRPGSPRFKPLEGFEGVRVEVEPARVRYHERGRYFMDRPKGDDGKATGIPHKEFARPRPPGEGHSSPRVQGGYVHGWKDVWQMEVADTSGLAGTLRYGPDSTFRDLNPPTPATRADFVVPENLPRTLADEIDGRPAEDRALPKPQKQGDLDALIEEPDVTAPELTGEGVVPKPPLRAGERRPRPATPEQVAAAERALAEAEAEDAAFVREAFAAHDAAKENLAAAQRALAEASAAHRATLATTPRPPRPIPAAKLNEHEAAIGTLQGEIDQIEAEIARHLDLSGREVDDLLRAADEHPEILRALDEGAGKVRDENVGIWEALAAEEEADDLARRAAKAMPDARDLDPIVFEERTPDDLARELDLLDRRNKRLSRPDRSVRSAAENVARTVEALFTPASDAQRAGLAKTVKDLAEELDGRLAALGDKLAHAIGQVHKGAETALPEAMEVLEEYARDFRAARREGSMQKPYYTNAARAYLAPDVRMTTADQKRLVAILDGFVMDEDMSVAELRAALRTESERIAARAAHPAPLQPPQRGDVLLAMFVGSAGAERQTILGMAGAGAVYKPEAVKALDEWALGTRRSAAARQAILRLMEDPWAYTAGPFTEFAARVPSHVERPLQGVTLAAAKKAEREAVAADTDAVTEFMVDMDLPPLPPSATREEVLARIEAVEEVLANGTIYVPRAVREQFAANVDAAVATYTGSAKARVSLGQKVFKQAMTIGLGPVRPGYAWANKWGDFGAALASVGWFPAAKMLGATLLDEAVFGPPVPKAIPGSAVLQAAVSVPTVQVARAIDALRAFFNPAAKPGQSIRDLYAGIDKVLSLVHLSYADKIGPMMDGGNVAVKLRNQPPRTGLEYMQLGQRYRLFDNFVTGELTRTLDEAEAAQGLLDAVSNRVPGRLRPAAEAAVGALPAAAWASRDAVNLVQTRRKFALWIALMEKGLSPEDAARAVNEAMPPYKGALWGWERTVATYLHPFLTFDKLNNRRVFRAMMNKSAWAWSMARPTARIKQWQRTQQNAARVMSAYFDNNDEYGYDRQSMAEEGDPLVVRARREELRREGYTDEGEIQAIVDREVLEGKIPRALERYEKGLDRLRAQGVSDDEIRRLVGLGGVPEWEGLNLYHAPDPLFSSLPDYIAHRAVAFRTRARSQALGAWNARNLQWEEVPDEVDAFAFPDDANQQGLLRMASLAAFAHGLGHSVYLMATTEELPAGYGHHLAKALQDSVVGDPFSDPAIDATMRLAGLSPEGESHDVALPAGMGTVLHRGGLVVPKSMQTRAGLDVEDSHDVRYYLTPAGMDALYLGGTPGRFVLAAVQTEALLRGMPEGGGKQSYDDTLKAFSRYTGQKKYTVSSSKVGGMQDYRANQRAAEYAKGTSKSEAGTIAFDDATERRHSVELAATAVRENPALVAAAAQRILDDQPLRPQDVAHLRAWLVVGKGRVDPQAAADMPERLFGQKAFARRVLAEVAK
jgi:hypothetical protein